MKKHLFYVLIPIALAAVSAVPVEADSRLHQSTFDAAHRLDFILKTVAESNVPELVGSTRWHDVVRSHRAPVRWSDDADEFRTRVNRMLDDAGISHLSYFGPTDFSFWHLRGAFPKIRIGDGKVTHVGLFPEYHDGRWFVRGVLEGSPASRADVMVGDELLTVDGRAYEPFVRLAGREGKPVRFVLARKKGQIHATTMTPVRECLFQSVQSSIIRSIRVEAHGDKRFAYVHVWTLLGRGQEYRRLLSMQDQVDGLLLDFRDGFGGITRNAMQFLFGTPHHQWPDNARADQCWMKPVVILTADGTRSAKELVVNRVKRHRRAPLLGEPTPGDVSAVDIGRLTPIGHDGLLMMPIYRFELEGRPTIPDHVVPRVIPYCAGDDPQLRQARDLLATMISH